MPNFYVVVPVLNEAPNLKGLIAAFHDLAAEFGSTYDLHFLLVDDGSTDGTAEQAQELAGRIDLQVLSHERNYGPGRAFATAFPHLGKRLWERNQYDFG